MRFISSCSCNNLKMHLRISDLQFQFYPDFSLNSSVIQHGSYNWNLTVFRHLLGIDGDTFTMAHPTVLRPKSFGSLALSGPRVDDPPIIDPNYLDHPDDVRVLIEGLKVLKAMEETEAFKKHGIRVARENLLCGRHHDPFSDGYLQCYARDEIDSYNMKTFFVCHYPLYSV